MSLYGRWHRDAGTFVLVTAEGLVGFLTLAMVIAASAVVVLLSRLGAPWWSLVVASGFPVGAGARLVKEAPTLARQYVTWRSGVIGRWETTHDAKRRAEEEVGGSEADGDRRTGREGLKGPSGTADSRQTLRLSRADTKDSEDKKRHPGQFVGRPEEERFWEYVNKTPACWLWTGKLTADGYPLFRVKRDHPLEPWTYVRAHRWAYEAQVGAIPEGLTLDHVRERGCHHRHCVNPAHLEPVTRAENTRRENEWRREQARTAEDTSKDTDLRGSA